ncbi:MAG: CHAT domain-containing tetratricopeptide repeat protein [Bacteroidota bacterium]
MICQPIVGQDHSLLISQADATYEKARQMLLLSQKDSAQAYALQAQTMYRQVEQWDSYLACAALISRIDLQQSYISTSLSYFLEAIQIARQEGLDQGGMMGILFEGLANIYRQQEQYDSATVYLQKAQKLKSSHFPPHSIEMAEFYTHWSHLCMEKTYTAEGIVFSDSAISLLQTRLQDSSHMSIAEKNYHLRLLGTVYYIKAFLEGLLGRNQESDLMNSISMRIRRQLPELDSIEYADNLHLLAIIYHKKGDHATGIELLEQVLNIYHRLDAGAFKCGVAYGHLGTIYFQYLSYPRQLHFQKSIDYFKRARNIFAELHLRRGWVYTHIQLANAFREMGRRDSAAHYISLVEPHVQEGSVLIPQMLADYYAYWGMTFVRQGNPELAIPQFKKQLEQEAQYGDIHSTNKAIILRSMGFTHLQLGKYEEALEYFFQGCEILGTDSSIRQLGQLPSMANVHGINELAMTVENIANVYKHWTDAKPDSLPLLKRSLTAHLLSIAMIDSLRSRVVEEEVREQLPEIYFHVYGYGLIAAYKLYQITSEEKYLEAAWQIIEKSKATLLTAGIRNSVASFSDDLIHQELMLRQAITDLKRKISGYAQTKDERTVTQLNQELLALKQKQKNFLNKVSKDHPGYFSKFFDPSTVSLSDFRQQYLQEEEIFLDYIIVASTIYILAVSKDQVSIYQRDMTGNNVANFFNLIRYFHTHPSEVDPAESRRTYLTAATEISQILLPPKEILAGHETLVISPFSGLGRLPFEALLIPEAGQDITHLSYPDLPYLFNQYQIRYAYSGSTLAYSMENQTYVSSNRVLGMAPYFFANHDTLEYSEGEVKQIGAMYPADLFCKETATEAQFKYLFSEYPIIHLSTVGVTDTTNALHAKLYFYPDLESDEDGILYLSEIYGLPLRAELVVLSACYTAEGQRHSGEGVISLGRGFRYAGAKSVLISLWKANDKLAPEILKKFYEHLSTGVPKAEALYLAKREFLNNSTPIEAQPYYWANFVMYGDSSSVLPPWWWQWRWSLGIGSALLLTSIFILLSVRFQRWTI